MKCTAKEIDATSVATSTPSMSASRKWTVGACDDPPFVLVDDIDE